MDACILKIYKRVPDADDKIPLVFLRVNPHYLTLNGLQLKQCSHLLTLVGFLALQ